MNLPWIRAAVRAMHGYTPGEQPQETGFIKLNTNENPYPPSPKVLAAVQAAATEQLRLYPDPSALEVRTAAARCYRLSPENVFVGNGSDELLSLIVRACVDPEDLVAYPYPTYSLYDTLVEIQAGRPCRVPYPDSFALPEGLWAVDAKLIFVCHPNSPSGTAVPVDTVATLAEQKPSTLVVVDEAYVDFAAESAIGLVERIPNVVVLRTLSKSFSLAGLRVGLAFGARETIAEIAKIKDSYNVNRASMAGARAALEDLAWMRVNVERICRTRGRLTEGLRRFGFEVPESQANFVLARKRGMRLEGLYRALKERRILVRYFDTPELYDAVRITVGTDAEIDALLHALEEIRLV